MVEADVTELVRYRERFRESFEKMAGAPLTYLPFAAHVVVYAPVHEHSGSVRADLTLRVEVGDHRSDDDPLAVRDE